jgi:hypothetical protein
VTRKEWQRFLDKHDKRLKIERAKAKAAAKAQKRKQTP